MTKWGEKCFIYHLGSPFPPPLPKREDLDEIGQRAYDRANTPGKTIVGLRGPAGIHLYSTKTVEAHNTINRYLRHEAGFDPKVREVAILTVRAKWIAASNGRRTSPRR